jgi:hypothetical protein
MAVTRKIIEELLRKLTEAENSRPNCTVEETIAAIDAVCAPDFQGRLNNQPFHDRETERHGERMLFTTIPDYHRTITRTIIDPPFVAFEWEITGTRNGVPSEVQGCSLGEIDENGLLRRGTVYLDTAQSPPLTE